MGENKRDVSTSLNLVARVSLLPAKDETVSFSSLSALAFGGKKRDPGNEVAVECLVRRNINNIYLLFSFTSTTATAVKQL